MEFGLAEDSQKFRVDDQVLGVGVGEHIIEFPGCVTNIHRYDHRAQFGQGQPAGAHGQRIGAHHRDMSAFGDAKVTQSVGGAIHDDS